jgi:protein SCO1/2
MNRAGLLTLTLALTVAASAQAQRSGMAYGKAPRPEPQLVDRTAVAIQENLGAQVPLDMTFRDENDRVVTLGECSGNKPTILVLAYYRCPMLCNQVLNGLVDCLGKVTDYDAGRDFNVVVVSFDPKDRPAIAWEKKQSYLRLFREEFKRPVDDNGWHFLTGQKPEIDALCATVGFRYEYDKVRKEFYHDSAIMILTPEGKLSRYLFGIEYLPVDVRLGLAGIKGDGALSPSLRDRVLLLCGFEYDHETGRYTPTVMTIVRITFAALVLVMAMYLIVTFRRGRRQSAADSTDGVALQTSGHTQPDLHPPVS